VDTRERGGGGGGYYSSTKRAFEGGLGEVCRIEWGLPPGADPPLGMMGMHEEIRGREGAIATAKCKKKL
jgi:hypothetical protein